MPGHRPARLVTLSSDVGAAYAAQMKSVLVRTVGPGRIIDLAHDLPAHAVTESAFLVRAMAQEFPAGTVHLVVVDPGVGGTRAPVAVECRDGSFLVGPDNGVLYPLAAALGLKRAVRLTPPRVTGSPRVGRTFDGRDLFAPAAARLAAGTPLGRLGRAFRLRPLDLPGAVRRPRGADGVVLHVDRFGNVITNIPTGWVSPGTRRLAMGIGRRARRTVPWVTHYEELGPGRLGALGSSFGLVELAVARGRADRRLAARVGARLALRWPRSPPSG